MALGALVVAATFTFPLWRPLLVNDVVNEAFPGLPPEMQSAFTRLPAEQQRMLMQMRGENAEMAIETAKALLGPSITVEDSMEALNSPVRVKAGRFIQIDVLHGASGTATIYRLPDDSLVLRLEDFRSTNGPDLRVLISKAADPRTPQALGVDYRELGRLKGNIGNQNYVIPADVRIGEFNSVVIYCDPFGVVFSTATLF